MATGGSRRRADSGAIGAGGESDGMTLNDRLAKDGVAVGGAGMVAGGAGGTLSERGTTTLKESVRKARMRAPELADVVARPRARMCVTTIYVAFAVFAVMSVFVFGLLVHVQRSRNDMLADMAVSGILTVGDTETPRACANVLEDTLATEAYDTAVAWFPLACVGYNLQNYTCRFNFTEEQVCLGTADNSPQRNLMAICVGASVGSALVVFFYLHLIVRLALAGCSWPFSDLEGSPMLLGLSNVVLICACVANIVFLGLLQRDIEELRWAVVLFIVGFGAVVAFEGVMGAYQLGMCGRKVEVIDSQSSYSEVEAKEEEFKQKFVRMTMSLAASTSGAGSAPTSRGRRSGGSGSGSSSSSSGYSSGSSSSSGSGSGNS